jgi:hypothetical protein
MVSSISILHQAMKTSPKKKNRCSLQTTIVKSRRSCEPKSGGHKKTPATAGVVSSVEGVQGYSRGCRTGKPGNGTKERTQPNLPEVEAIRKAA